jgi:hypothetical protein
MAPHPRNVGVSSPTPRSSVVSVPNRIGMSVRIFNAILIFSLSLLFTGMMFQRATNSVQKNESDLASADNKNKNGN